MKIQSLNGKILNWKIKLKSKQNKINHYIINKIKMDSYKNKINHCIGSFVLFGSAGRLGRLWFLESCLERVFPDVFIHTFGLVCDFLGVFAHTLPVYRSAVPAREAPYPSGYYPSYIYIYREIYCNILKYINK